VQHDEAQEDDIDAAHRSRPGGAFLGRVAADYLGPAGSVVLTLAAGAYVFLGEIAALVGLATTLASFAAVPAGLWAAALFGVNACRLARQSLKVSLGLSVVLAGLNIGLLLAASARRPSEGRAGAGAGAGTWLPPSNVPAPRAALVGRERELVLLRDLVAGPSTRLVTITGAGGSGKTAVALRAAAPGDRAGGGPRAGALARPARAASRRGPAGALGREPRRADPSADPGRHPGLEPYLAPADIEAATRQGQALSPQEAIAEAELALMPIAGTGSTAAIDSTDTLTPREREAARLLATGRTDRQIAAGARHRPEHRRRARASHAHQARRALVLAGRGADPGGARLGRLWVSA
jgi:hypothetical protein